MAAIFSCRPDRAWVLVGCIPRAALRLPWAFSSPRLRRFRIKFAFHLIDKKPIAQYTGIVFTFKKRFCANNPAAILPYAAKCSREDN